MKQSCPPQPQIDLWSQMPALSSISHARRGRMFVADQLALMMYGMIIHREASIDTCIHSFPAYYLHTHMLATHASMSSRLKTFASLLPSTRPAGFPLKPAGEHQYPHNSAIPASLLAEHCTNTILIHSSNISSAENLIVEVICSFVAQLPSFETRITSVTVRAISIALPS